MNHPRFHLIVISKEENEMSTCNLDHSLADVQAKLEQQAPFLPEQITQKLTAHLNRSLAQSELNEIFHLLKKYDLSSKEEQEERNKKLLELL